MKTKKHARTFPQGRVCAVFAALLLCFGMGMSTPAFLKGMSGDAAPFDEGRIEEIVVHGTALEGNLLYEISHDVQDSCDRNVSVYLPPDYDLLTTEQYPVVYLLHGAGSTNTRWTSFYVNIKDIADSLIAQGDMQPMIIVMPDASHSYGGSMYTNSIVTGNWEDFITQDLVQYIDNTFRTLPQPSSRGIAGHSMGGYGSMKLAMKHPDVYSAVYVMSGRMGLDDIFLAEKLADDSWPDVFAGISAPVDHSYHLAFSPNPGNPPYYCDLLAHMVDTEVSVVDSVWDRWLTHHPIDMFAQYGANLQDFRGIRLEYGTSDPYTFVIRSSNAFSDTLIAAGIGHVLEEFDGGHSDQLAERLKTSVLPFFSETLYRQLENEGTIEEIVVHGTSLEGNFLYQTQHDIKDTCDRNISVYLPPGYDTDTDTSYPVVYFLHGFGGYNVQFFENSNVTVIMDTLIEQGMIEPMIIVTPDARTIYGGSMYTNSIVTGNWEDFMTQDLVQYIDNTYRTLPQPSSRGISGFSMGGFGSMKLAMKHPEIYSAVYSMSGRMGMDEIYVDELIGDARWPQVFTGDIIPWWDIRFSVCFSPNMSNPPYYCDYLAQMIGDEVVVNESTLERWVAHHPMGLFAQYGSNLADFRGVRLEYGTLDGNTFVIRTSSAFSDSLTAAGIPHVLYEYEGGHGELISERLEGWVLPFFSQTLSRQMEPVDPAEYHTFPGIKEILLQERPQTGNAALREDCIMALDSMIINYYIDNATLHPDIEEYYEDMLAKALLDIKNEVVTEGASVWLLYNFGFVIKTASVTFGIDLCNWPEFDFEEFLELADLIDVYFISHWHLDHFCEELVLAMNDRGKPVVAPPVPEWWAHLTATGMDAGTQMTVDTLDVTAHDGVHFVPVRQFEITTPEGIKFLHTGDNEETASLPDFNPGEVDVLLFNNHFL
ncbi:alpha/beta fold hydrolase, partial [candidate division KSB1 bacterium]